MEFLIIFYIIPVIICAISLRHHLKEELDLKLHLTFSEIIIMPLLSVIPILNLVIVYSLMMEYYEQHLRDKKFFVQVPKK